MIEPPKLPPLPPLPGGLAEKAKRDDRIKKRRRAGFIRMASPVLLSVKEFNLHNDPLDRYRRAITEAERLADILAERGYL